MDEQRLWAPWRLAYVAGDETVREPPPPERWLPDADEECFVCRAAAQYADEAAARRENLVVAVGAQTLVLLNRYPYANGHLLVCPRRHVGDFEKLTTKENQEAMVQLTRFTTLYRKLIRAEGFNIGLNLGHVAGAGLPGHLHWHLVPRWSGDVNFMPSTAGVRMIPQSLEALWEALWEAIMESDAL